MIGKMNKIGLPFRIILYGAVLLFIYCEFVTYWILPYTWMQQPHCSAKYCKKLLLVADPQIVGPEWDGLFFLDWIAIFDSDRYIKRTFVKALNYLQPDFIIFLGDIMDQGFFASNSEFEVYLERIKDIFEIPSSLKNTKLIFSPGDNDIGGEFLLPSIVSRFGKKFNQTKQSLLTDFIEFCRINVMASTIQQSKFLNENIIRVALSHIPLIPEDFNFLKKVVKKVRPHVIFSGHVHTSVHYSTHENDLYEFTQNNVSSQDKNSTIYKLEEGLIYEITVPTCSYRMGVPEMGYGAAFLDLKKKSLYYNVLWLPRRFHQIYTYLFILVFILLLLTLKIPKRISRCKMFSFKRSSKSTKNLNSIWP